jgi:nitrate/nitrite transport system ATP-binding protein
MASLELRRISRGFGAGKQRHAVLRGVDLAVHDGTIACVIGASGSGKTTLVALVAGLLEPEAGEILLDGAPVSGPGPDRGVVFQTHALLPWLTALENVQLAVDAVVPDWSAGARRTRAEHAVGLVGLAAARHKRPPELSGGMRQRVAVARALAMEPRLLVLDEPFSALDALTRATLQAELVRLCTGARRTALMVTNDVDEAILLADRIHVLAPAPGGGSTLAPPIPVGLPRPRTLRALSRSTEYRRIRLAVVETLVAARTGAAERRAS